MFPPNLSYKAALPWVALACGVLASVFAALQVKQTLEQETARQFASNCDQVALKVQERLGAYALILRGGAALFAASLAVERNEWQAYVETLRASGSVPGVQGIGFAELILPEQLAAHVARVRTEGFTDYSIRPPGSREVYTSIVYLEPFRDRNLRAFGFDMYTEPVRRAAMEQARDTGEAALSGKVELVQETGTQIQAGALMYVPVYRNGAVVDTPAQRRAALIGWAYSPYRMNDLMTGILGDWEARQGKAIDLAIYDGDAASPSGLLFDSKPDLAPNTHSPFYQRRALDFNGRHWLLAFDRTATAPGVGYAPAWSTLVAGLALSGLLFWLLRSVINTQATAVRIAAGLTAEIRQSQESLRTSEEKIHLLLDSTAEAIYGIDLDGHCTFCNSACLQLLGYRHPDELLGENMHWRIHAKHADGQPFPIAECRIFQALKTGKPMHVEDEVLWRRDGTSFPAEYWSYPQRSGGLVVGAVVSFLDITARQQVEVELRRSNHELEQFSYSISHDMRQPLRMISSYLQLLEMGLAQRLDAEQREYLHFAVDGAKRLDAMLLGLLEYSRIGRSGEPRVWADSRPMLEEALLFMWPAMTEAHAVVKIEGDWPRILASPDEMLRLLQNLVGNAIKFRAPGRAPEIVLTGAVSDNQWRLSVADNGIGIPPGQAGRLFAVFQRLHSRTAFEGTGIGLALCRKIAEHHGGKLWVESAGEGQGSTFIFELPLSPPDTPADAPAAVAAPRPPGGRTAP